MAPVGPSGQHSVPHRTTLLPLKATPPFPLWLLTLLRCFLMPPWTLLLSSTKAARVVTAAVRAASRSARRGLMASRGDSHRQTCSFSSPSTSPDTRERATSDTSQRQASGTCRDACGHEPQARVACGQRAPVMPRGASAATPFPRHLVRHTAAPPVQALRADPRPSRRSPTRPPREASLQPRNPPPSLPPSLTLAIHSRRGVVFTRRITQEIHVVSPRLFGSERKQLIFFTGLVLSFVFYNSCKL